MVEDESLNYYLYNLQNIIDELNQIADDITNNVIGISSISQNANMIRTVANYYTNIKNKIINNYYIDINNI